MEKPPNKALDITFAALRITAAAICAFLMWTFLYTIGLKQINHGNVIGCMYCGSVIVLVIIYPFLKKKTASYRGESLRCITGGIRGLLYGDILLYPVGDEPRRGQSSCGFVGRDAADRYSSRLYGA